MKLFTSNGEEFWGERNKAPDYAFDYQWSWRNIFIDGSKVRVAVNQKGTSSNFLYNGKNYLVSKNKDFANHSEFYTEKI
jgi:hypothetical protein